MAGIGMGECVTSWDTDAGRDHQATVTGTALSSNKQLVGSICASVCWTHVGAKRSWDTNGKVDMSPRSKNKDHISALRFEEEILGLEKAGVGLQQCGMRDGVSGRALDLTLDSWEQSLDGNPGTYALCYSVVVLCCTLGRSGAEGKTGSSV